MSSILTNQSALVALDTLRGINSNLSSVQSEIATGKKISNAKDNSAIYAISTVIQTDIDSFKQISDSLNLGSATIGVARSASEQVTGLLQDAKELIVSAQEENVDRTKIQASFDEIVGNIGSIVGAASFNGQNLIDDTGGSISILSSLDRGSDGTVTASSISVSRADLTTSVGGGLEGLDAIDLTTDNTTAAAGLTAIEGFLQTAIDAASSFGAKQQRIDTQNNFLSSLTDNLTIGVGALVDSDLEEASARLQSLQVQQQLGVQALSIANQGPQQLLSLFR